ncbi:Metalloprotease TIKI1 [Armadillidium nasatum]|uniref:Metalloprotease TIKI homolog n=1 Tax=Armadillidium nasatum TaxID=96803 RepID=A0A5N5TP11_9CRUS|nr:Metalloprotease TIKI1 [Armadillidium nasatum]
MSDSVFFELDLTDPYTISALTSCQLLPKGENLSNILPGDLFKRLKDHLSYVRSQMTSWVTHDQRGRGLYADYLFNAITGNWERKRPVWVMLMVNSLTKGDIRSRGVPVLDLFLAQEAERQKKQTGAIERVEEQCVPLNTLNYTQGVFALDHTLSQQENLRQGRGRPTHSTDSLIALYNCGSLDAVVLAQDSTQASSLSVPQLGNQSLPPVEAETAQRIDNYFRRELILKRNERMGKRVVRILKSNPNQSFFFAFGAEHKRDFFGTMNRGEGEPDITPTPRKPFNDLWVRIDNPEFKESLGLYNRNEEYLDNQEKKEVEESLRVWYGLPTSGISPKKENKMTIILLLMILFINIFL